MKKIIYIYAVSLLIMSCNQENAQLPNNQTLTNMSIEELNTQKAEYTQKINNLSSQLEKINNALEGLSQNENRPLITAFFVQSEVFEHSIEVQANIKTRKNILLYPEFAGRLIKLYVDEGQSVRKGELLATIDDAGIKDQLDQFKLELELARTTYERTSRLWEQKIGSEMMFLEAKTRFRASKKQVSQIRQKLAKTKIYSPFDGIVDEIPGKLGSNLVPGVTPVIRVVNLDSMYAESDVPENYLPNIIKGSKASVTIPVLNEVQITKIRKTGNFITPSNRTFKVEAPINNPKGFIKPNLNARLSIIDYVNSKAIMVPIRVIRQNANGNNYVFVLTNPEKGNGYTTEQRIVELGKTKQEMIEISAGLNPEELIVDEGVSMLVNGQKVKRIIK